MCDTYWIRCRIKGCENGFNLHISNFALRREVIKYLCPKHFKLAREPFYKMSNVKTDESVAFEINKEGLMKQIDKEWIKYEKGFSKHHTSFVLNALAHIVSEDEVDSNWVWDTY